jgi:hypothetical protein
VVEVVAQFHRAGIWFGDLSPASFFQGYHEALTLVGQFGIPTGNNPSELRLAENGFLAPEVRHNKRFQASADVFGLGKIAAALFGAEIKQDSTAIQIADRLRQLRAPTWVIGIVEVCLAREPSERPKDGDALLAEIESIRSSRLSDSLLVVEPPKAGVFQEKQKDGVQSFEVVSKKRTDRPDVFTKERALSPRVIVAAIALGVAVTVAIAYRRGTQNLDFSSASVTARYLADMGYSPKIEGADAIRLIIKVAKSGDAASHEALLTLMSSFTDVEMQRAVEDAILAKAERDGFFNTVMVIRKWQSDNPGRQVSPPNVSLSLIDDMVPASERRHLLEQLMLYSPTFAIRLAAGLLLDRGDKSEDRATLAYLLTGNEQDEDIQTRPLPVVLLSIPQIPGVFEVILEGKLQTLGQEQLLWLLSRVIQQTDPLKDKVIAAIRDSTQLMPLQKRALSLVCNEGDMAPPEIVGAVAHAITGKLTADEINVVSSWYDNRAIDLLMLFSVLAPEPEQLETIFAGMVSRNTSREPSSGLLKWLKQQPNQKRLRFMVLPGFFFMIDVLSAEERAQLRKVVEGIGDEPALLKLVGESPCIQCVEFVVSEFGHKLSSATLYKLLTHKSRELRIDGIRLIAKYSGIGSRQLLIDHYNRERDEDVRKVYREMFDFVDPTYAPGRG